MGLPPFAETFARLAEPSRGLRNQLAEPVRRTLFGGLVNPLGCGYLRLTFCVFDNLRVTLGGVLTERCTLFLHLESSTMHIDADSIRDTSWPHADL